MTFISGGILTEKYAFRSFSVAAAVSDEVFCIMSGKTVAPVRYDTSPANIVEPYANATVTISILPALPPRSDIAGATSPRMISGMANPKN